MPTDWQELAASTVHAPAVVDPRRRLGGCLGAFILLLIAVWCRAAQLEFSQGAAFRADALNPIRHETLLPASRGRILARDGTVLAYDREVAAVAVEYRWLEDPPRQAWLEQLARQRLSKDQRRDAGRLAEEIRALRRERDELHRRLAALCGVDPAQWRAGARKIQDRVERIAADARRRRMAGARAPLPPPDDAPWGDRLAAALRQIFGPAHDAAPENITVAEELADHILAENVPAAAVAEIERHAGLYPGARVIHVTRRTYPCGDMAGHVLGYLGPPVVNAGRPLAGLGIPTGTDSPPSWNSAEGVPYRRSTSPGMVQGDSVGSTGVEQQCQALLCGRPGIRVEATDHAGRVRQVLSNTAAVAGDDVTLTIDARLQRTAEDLLDGALRRLTLQSESGQPCGGAAVVIDVRDGEILAAASAPRFDPAVMAGGDSSRRQALLADPAHPLFHRAVQMALPPGSVFKTVTAVALLESAALDPAATFYCQGYWKQPDRLRCALYVRHGTGHGDVTLADALAESCNVYFFHHAEELPPQALVDWAHRLGFGAATGVDMPGEARGVVPTPDSMERLEGHRWRLADTQAMSVGQGSLTATPLQVARMMAAVANGGLLVAPHVVRQEVSSAGVSPFSPKGGPKPTLQPPPQAITGLSGSTLAAIRAGLLQTVAGPEGTAHGSLDLPQISIAGKTGTAETGAGQAEHAWFAGYFPADRPRYAMAVVLEHAGDAATAACPVAKRLVLRMLELGLLDPKP